jgi:hypothetical protein
MLIASAAVPLKNREALGAPGDVVSFVGHITMRPVVQNAASELMLTTTGRT